MRFEIQQVDSICSTNSALKDMLKTGQASQGYCLVAKQQTGGRGRLTRSFCSPVGGLYMSFALTPDLDTQMLPNLTILCGVAVCNAICRIYDLIPQIKLPNDIYLFNKKVCGILCEAVTHGSVCHVVVGMGLNVNTDPQLLPQVASSLLHLTQQFVPIDQVLPVVLEEFVALYSDFDSNLPQLLSFAQQHKAVIL